MAVPYSRYFLGFISWYGLLIAVGASLAVILSSREAKRLNLPKDTIIDLALWVLPIGILGARAYYVLFSWESYQSNPVSALFIWEGGLAIYGGILAGLAVVVVFCRKRRLPLPVMADILVPGVALAQSIGRWGNYFNQEAYGIPLPENSPLCFFPLAVLIPENGILTWHVATFFLESVIDFTLFLFLVIGKRKLFRRPGDAACFYFLFYAAGRIFVENLRMDSLYLGISVRVSQLISALLCTAGMICLIVRRREEKGLGMVELILAAVSLLYDAAVLLFCIRSSAFSFTFGQETVFLGCFSFVTILTVLKLYGSTPQPEVFYAKDQV